MGSGKIIKYVYVADIFYQKPHAVMSACLCKVRMLNNLLVLFYLTDKGQKEDGNETETLRPMASVITF